MSKRRRPRDDSDPSTIPGRLRPLGFSLYAEYLASDHWQDVRRRYRASDRPQRCGCGARGTQLHHLTYARLGAERLTDLLLLCEACHLREHGLVRPSIAKPRKDQNASRKRRRTKQRQQQAKRRRPAPTRVAELSPGVDFRPLPFAVEVPKMPPVEKPRRRNSNLKEGEPKPWDKHSLLAKEARRPTRR